MKKHNLEKTNNIDIVSPESSDNDIEQYINNDFDNNIYINNNNNNDNNDIVDTNINMYQKYKQNEMKEYNTNYESNNMRYHYNNQSRDALDDLAKIMFK